MLSPFQQLVWEKRGEAAATLALQKPLPGINMSELARQVQALQHVREKAPSFYRQGMDFPLALSLEQCSSEATGRFKAGLVPGKRMADLTGGLGVDSFCFAQCFEEVHYVEQNPVLSAAAAHNFQALDANNISVHGADALQFLQQQGKTFDLLYLDPARRDEHQKRVYRLEDCQPDVLNLKSLLFEHAPLVLLKTAPMLDLKLAMQQLGQVRQIWVIALREECKEVLYLLDKSARPGEPVPISTVQIQRDGSHTRFDFDYRQEEKARVSLSAPLRYLYEPHAAILKGGAFKSFALQFGLDKLQENTHLYTSEDFVSGVQGRCFEVTALCKYDKKTVQLALQGTRANVATRNFPDKPEQVRKKLGLQDGGDVYLFALSTVQDQKVICLCRKVTEGEQV